jgi:hypothetical protein
MSAEVDEVADTEDPVASDAGPDPEPAVGTEPEPEPERPAAPPGLGEGSTTTKQSVTLADGDTISFNSPRMVQALLQTGIVVDELQPRRVEDPAVIGNPKVVAVYEKAFESERLKCLDALLRSRGTLMAAPDKLAPMVVLNAAMKGGDVQMAGGALKVEIDRELLAREQQRMDKVLTGTARAGNRRFGQLGALRAHTKAPYKTDLDGKTLRPLNRPGRAGRDAVALRRRNGAKGRGARAADQEARDVQPGGRGVRAEEAGADP